MSPALLKLDKINHDLFIVRVRFAGDQDATLIAAIREPSLKRVKRCLVPVE